MTILQGKGKSSPYQLILSDLKADEWLGVTLPIAKLLEGQNRFLYEMVTGTGETLFSTVIAKLYARAIQHLRMPRNTNLPIKNTAIN